SDLLRLRELVGRERNAKQRDRYRVVLLAAEGLGGRELKREEIAAAGGRSRQFVDGWVKRYRRDGGGGVRAGKQPRRAPFVRPGAGRRAGRGRGRAQHFLRRGYPRVDRPPLRQALLALGCVQPAGLHGLRLALPAAAAPQRVRGGVPRGAGGHKKKLADDVEA